MWNNWRDLDVPLAGLVEAVTTVLSGMLLEVEDERVADIPSARVIRYYQSSGLIDRPVRYDGRRAMYGFRHLVQIVAIKVLQSESEPLSRIQGLLAGRATADLARLISASAGNVGGIADKEKEEVVARAATPRPVASSSVLRAELAPGVFVFVDPTLVSDSAAVLAALAAALPPRGET